jgi:hypothetical protein
MAAGLKADIRNQRGSCMSRTSVFVALLALAAVSFGFERVAVCEEAYQET